MALVDIYKTYRTNDKVERARLIIPQLNEVGWAWYYGDDGHYDAASKACFFHTEGLGEEGAKIVANGLSEFLGVEGAASVYMYHGGTPKCERFMVRIKKNESKKFIQRVKDHMATGLEYKTGEV